jgi:hypothetical protein
MKLELTLDEVQLVINALAKLPLELVLPTFEKIKLQAQEQLKNIKTEESTEEN